MNGVDPLAMAAGIVFFDRSDRVLLFTRRTRIGLGVCPAARLSQVKPHEAALREVREEIGLDATIDHMVGVFFNQHRNSMIFGFVGQLPDGAKSVIADLDELDDIGWFATDRLPSPTRT